MFLKRINSYVGEHTVKYQEHIPNPIGAKHNHCNINLKLSKKLPIIFHNLQGYGGHIIFRELNNFDVDIDIIP